MGWTNCEVVRLELDDLQATALAIALNRTGEQAEWDEAVLSRLLQELRDAEALDGVGFADADIQELLDGLGEAPIDVLEDEAPSAPDDPVTQRGDLWVLGDHRLLCGDSASPADVDRLPQW